MVAQTSGNGNSVKKTQSFFRGVKSEAKKVNWPNKKELFNYTLVVLIGTAALTSVIWLLDLGIHSILQLILGQ